MAEREKAYYEREESEDELSPQIPLPFVNPMNNWNGSIETMTNPEGDLKKMELALRSIVMNSEGKVISQGEPLMNEIGINSILGQVQSVANQLAVMSNFNEKKIDAIGSNFSNTIAIDLMINRLKYGIINPSARTKISTIAGNYIHIALLRGLNEGDRRFWKGSQQDIRHEVVQNMNKQGMFSKMFGRGNN